MALSQFVSPQKVYRVQISTAPGKVGGWSDAVLPHGASNDFPADLRRARKAAIALVQRGDASAARVVHGAREVACYGDRFHGNEVIRRAAGPVTAWRRVPA